MKFIEFESVKVNKDINDQIKRGNIGVVVMVFDIPDEAYEVEFVNEKGFTKDVLLLHPNELDKVENA